MKKSSLLLLILTVFACKKEEKQQIEPLLSIPKEVTLFPVDFYKNNSKEIAKLEHEIEHFYQSKINLDEFSGQFLVAKNGKILFEDVQGFSNYEQKQTLNKNTSLHLASISKVLTAAVVLRFVDNGKIKLDDSFKSYFPEFPYEKITIRTLLNHRSGLANYLYFADNDTIWNKNKTLTNTDILNILATKNIPLDFSTATKFSYNNTNYALLALLVEKITQKTYPEAMNELLFKPLQMNNTFVFDYDDTQKDTVSQSYKSTWEKIPYDYLDAVYGDKNIYSTAEDLLKFDNATYSKDFFSDSLRNKIFKGYSYEKPGVKNYGLGIRLNEWENYATLFYHNGWWHGNTTSYTTLKNDTVAIFCLSNKYTRKVYQAKALSGLFGNYPFEIEED